MSNKVAVSVSGGTEVSSSQARSAANLNMWREISCSSEETEAAIVQVDSQAETTDSEMWSPVVRRGESPPAAPGPCSRAKHSATVLGGYLYVLGGRSGNVPLKDFWRYSLADGAWERLEARGEPPPALQEHSAVAHDSSLYVFGGELGFSSTETPLWVYDTQTMWWRKLGGGGRGGSAGRAGRRTRGAGEAPRGRRGHSAHVLGDVMLIYGGYQDLKGSSNEMWAFHFESESWHAVETSRGGVSAPARHRHAAALHDRRLYVHAGMHDLRECGDLWKYDTVSRSWCAVRCKVSPGPLHGHVAVRVPGYLYVFGGETQARLNCDLWKFHFATETWERVCYGGGSWPAPRADAVGLLTSELPVRAAVCRPARAPHVVREPPGSAAAAGGFLREIGKLSQFNLRRGGGNSRCSYSVLAHSAERDSTESLRRAPSPPPAHPHRIVKSHSAYAIDKRRPLSCGGAIRSGEPREADEAESRRQRPAAPPRRLDISREPISVPDFADLVLPTPVLSPVEATKLVYLDSEEEEEMRREDGFSPPQPARAAPPEPVVRRIEVLPRMSKSASVRFRSAPDAEDESELSTSDYASAERVNRLSVASASSGVGNGESAFGFCNPHYLGPDVQEMLGGAAAVAALNTPDSGVGEGGAPGAGDVELLELGPRRARAQPPPERAHEWEEREAPPLSLLLVGGRETPHAALLQRPLALWNYRL